MGRQALGNRENVCQRVQLPHSMRTDCRGHVCDLDTESSMRTDCRGHVCDPDTESSMRTGCRGHVWPWHGEERLCRHKMLEMLAVNRLARGGRCLRDMVPQSTSYKRNGQFRKKPLLQALCWAWTTAVSAVMSVHPQMKLLRGGTADTAASDIYCWNTGLGCSVQMEPQKDSSLPSKARTATTSPGSTGRTDVNMAQFSTGFQNGQGLARHWENIQLFFDKS